MCYTIKVIKNKAELIRCQTFDVANYQWNSVVSPRTYGAMGYIPGAGLYVEMVCEETDPLRDCRHHKDMVCKDSAMEIFLAFEDKGTTLTNDSFYLNLEVNANGAMYAKSGHGRKGRQFLSEEIYEKSQVSAVIEADEWKISLLIPEEFLLTACGWDYKNPEKELYCNFYKISEHPKIEHYGSFRRIDNAKPNFHLPVFFAKTKIDYAGGNNEEKK